MVAANNLLLVLLNNGDAKMRMLSSSLQIVPVRTQARVQVSHASVHLTPQHMHMHKLMPTHTRAGMTTHLLHDHLLHALLVHHLQALRAHILVRRQLLLLAPRHRRAVLAVHLSATQVGGHDDDGIFEAYQTALQQQACVSVMLCACVCVRGGVQCMQEGQGRSTRRLGNGGLRKYRCAHDARKMTQQQQTSVHA